MPSSECIQKPQDFIDVNKRLPLSANFARQPTDLRYHRYYDGEGRECEIFVPPGREQEVLDLQDKEDWKALGNFPPFSDRPAVWNVHPNIAGLPQADGTTKWIFIPQDEKSQNRFNELASLKDWDAMEKEFEPWANQPIGNEQQQEDWERGIERCARARARTCVENKKLREAKM